MWLHILLLLVAIILGSDIKPAASVEMTYEFKTPALDNLVQKKADANLTLNTREIDVMTQRVDKLLEKYERNGHE